MANTTITVEPRPVPECSDPPAPSDRQRLRIHVPNVSTTLWMGADADGGRAGDAGPPNYDGFGVSTVGCVYMTSDGQTAIESKGSMSLFAHGSSSDLFLGANHDVGLAAGGGEVLVHGGGGVTIAGGVAWGDSAQVGPASGPTVEDPAWKANAASTVSTIGTVCTSVDIAAAALSIGMAGWSLRHGIKGTSFLSWAGIVADAANIAGNSVGMAGGDPLGGATLYGSTGLILATAATAGLYSAFGTGIASSLGVQIVAPSVGVSGLEVGVVGGKETSIGGGKLELVGAHDTELATRSGVGKLTLLGSRIVIGKPSLTAPDQSHTSMVHLTAKSGITIVTKPTGEHDSAPRFANGISIKSEDEFDVFAKKKILIHSGDEKSIELRVVENDSHVKLTKGKIHLFAGDTEMTLEKTKGAMIRQGDAGSLKVKKSKIELAFGSNYLKVKKNGKHKLKGKKLTFNGQKIMLG